MNRRNPLKIVYWPFLTIRARVLTNMIAPHVVGEKGLDLGAGNMLVSRCLSAEMNVQMQGLDVIDMNLTSLPHTLFDGEKIPFDDKYFDFTLLIGVLHHVDKQIPLFSEAIRVTKKRIIILEDVYMNAPEKLWIKIRDVIGNIPEELHMNFALNFHTEKEWEDLFQDMDLRTVYKKTFFNYLRLTHHTLYILEIN